MRKEHIIKDLETGKYLNSKGELKPHWSEAERFKFKDQALHRLNSAEVGMLEDIPWGCYTIITIHLK